MKWDYLRGWGEEKGRNGVIWGKRKEEMGLFERLWGGKGGNGVIWGRKREEMRLFGGDWGEKKRKIDYSREHQVINGKQQRFGVGGETHLGNKMVLRASNALFSAPNSRRVLPDPKIPFKAPSGPLSCPQAHNPPCAPL